MSQKRTWVTVKYCVKKNINVLFSLCPEISKHRSTPKTNEERFQKGSPHTHWGHEFKFRALGGVHTSWLYLCVGNRMTQELLARGHGAVWETLMSAQSSVIRSTISTQARHIVAEAPLDVKVSTLCPSQSW